MDCLAAMGDLGGIHLRLREIRQLLFVLPYVHFLLLETPHLSISLPFQFFLS